MRLFVQNHQASILSLSIFYNIKIVNIFNIYFKLLLIYNIIVIIIMYIFLKVKKNFEYCRKFNKKIWIAQNIGFIKYYTDYVIKIIYFSNLLIEF
jgi:hypothetical protein